MCNRGVGNISKKGGGLTLLRSSIIICMAHLPNEHFGSIK